MKSSRRCTIVLIFTLSTIAAAQAQTPAEPYKPVLDLLQGITTLPVKDWSSQPAAMAHCEEAPASSEAAPVAVGAELVLPACLHGSIEIPKQWNGYNLEGARLTLDLTSTATRKSTFLYSPTAT